MNKNYTNPNTLFYRYAILIAFFLLNFFTANCQQRLKDSLASLIKNTPENKEKIEIYLDYGKSLAGSNPDSAEIFYEKAKELAERLNDLKGMSKYLSYQINLFNQKAQFEEGLTAAQKDVAIAQQSKDPKILIEAYNDVANEYEYLADYQQASENYIKSLKLATDAGNLEMQSKIDDNLASVFLWLKDDSLAYNYSTKAFVIAQQRHDTVTMGNCLLNTGVAEVHQKKYNDALANHNTGHPYYIQLLEMQAVIIDRMMMVSGQVEAANGFAAALLTIQ